MVLYRTKLNGEDVILYEDFNTDFKDRVFTVELNGVDNNCMTVQFEKLEDAKAFYDMVNKSIGVF